MRLQGEGAADMLAYPERVLPEDIGDNGGHEKARSALNDRNCQLWAAKLPRA